LKLEVAATRSTTYEGEAQEREGFRFSKPAQLAIVRSEAAELNQACLVRMKDQDRTIGIVRAKAKIGLQKLAYNIRRLVTLERMATGIDAQRHQLRRRTALFFPRKQGYFPRKTGRRLSTNGQITERD
jgi:hypothetical protein